MSLTLRIKVIPGARQDRIEKFGELLKIKVRTAPEKGRANVAVAALMADFLGLSHSQVVVSAGFTSALKTLQIDHLTQTELEARLKALPDK